MMESLNGDGIIMMNKFRIKSVTDYSDVGSASVAPSQRDIATININKTN